MTISNLIVRVCVADMVLAELSFCESSRTIFSYNTPCDGRLALLLLFATNKLGVMKSDA